MLQKKSKCCAAILTSLCSFLYVPLMVGVLSNSKPNAVYATAGETTVWIGDETDILFEAANLPVENPEYLHFTFSKDDGATIYDYNLDSELKVLTSADHGIVSFTDSEWSSMLASGGFWIWSDAEHIIEISYKAKESPASYDLWIAGIQVTSENKDNILPSGSKGEGTASFDPVTNTLSLNNFDIEPQVSGSTETFGYGDYLLNEIGIASKLSNLTIDVSNKAYIGDEVEYEAEETELADFDFKLGIVSTDDVEITGSGKFFVYCGMGTLVAENLTVDMDFGDEADSQLTMEAFCPNDVVVEEDVAAVLVNNDFSLNNGYMFVNCFEDDGIESVAGDILIKNSQLETDCGKDAFFVLDGNVLINNAYVGLESHFVTIEAPGVGDSGNITIENHSIVYDLLTEDTAASLNTNGKITVDNSRLYLIGFDAENYHYSLICEEFDLKGDDSLIYVNSGMQTVMYEQPVKINISGGTLMTSSKYGLMGGGENESDFVIGSESTPFTIKNGGLLSEDWESITPYESADGNVPMNYDIESGVYCGYLMPLDAEANDGFMEINTYASVSMTDYEYGGTVSTPSIDRELAKLWGEEIEEVIYLYYADGETIDNADVWEDIEPETLEPGTYNMVALLIDHAMPMFQYYSDPVEFEVTNSTTTIEKPEADETEFIYTGEEQTYVIEENDAYTVSNNVQTDAGEYEVTVSLKDPTTTTWDDGTTDDLTYDFVIAKAVQVIEISDIAKTFDNTPISIGEKDIYRTTNYYTKLGDGAVTVEYKLATEDDSKYTTTAPKEAGNYTLKVSVAEGTNYLEGSEPKISQLNTLRFLKLDLAILLNLLQVKKPQQQ